MENPPQSVGPGGKLPVLDIKSHRELAAAQQEIVNRLHANPGIARLLLVNPVCAFQDIGVKVSPEIAKHILLTLQNSAATTARREALTSSLREAAGERPQPSHPAWVAKFLFEKLKLKPLATTGATPVYKPMVDPALAARQLASIPKLNTAPALPHPDHGTSFVFQPITPGVRNLDLDTPGPQLPEAREAPAAVDLTTLYFYKDVNQHAHDLLELGIIESQSFQISTPDTYRKIKSGKIPNPWGWIGYITFTPPAK
jgi:hypothetical protein